MLVVELPWRRGICLGQIDISGAVLTAWHAAGAQKNDMLSRRNVCVTRALDG